MELWFGEQYGRENGRYLQIQVDNVLEKVKSPFQEIAVVNSPAFGKILVNDSIVMLTEADEAGYHEMIAHVPLCVHPKVAEVLVIGGGDGGTVREILKHSDVKRVDVCEIDEQVVEVCRRHFPDMANSFDNDKVHLYYQDGAQFLTVRRNQYDVVIVDSTDPVGPGITLFTEQFYQSIFHSLKEDGIAVSQMESIFWHGKFIQNTFLFLNRIFPIARYYFTMVPTYPSGMIGFSLCSKKYHPVEDFKPEKTEKLTNLKYYHAELHKAAFILPAFAQKLI
ncbi:MAG TPA: polyamine aminopropyltransferase [Atribacterota bacterium]|nr:polyamine aminopropyltransferase [Atribacterota bacterium]